MLNKPKLLDSVDFLHVLRCAPLVSIDLVVMNENGLLLAGLRRNKPAKGKWFVPGGRILKNEAFSDAFSRITRDELGKAYGLDEACLLGVYEHFYADNFFDSGDTGTHYVVLAYRLRVYGHDLRLDIFQHARYRWLAKNELTSDDQVHPYTRAYSVHLGD